MVKSMNIYFCIDLKSFYASVECVIRGLDPFKVNLVVADISRGMGAITLAATPKIKELGVKSRGRLYEIPSNIKYTVIKPRMRKYMEYSANIYGIYLKYFSKDDIHVYSIDEVFIDVTPYMNLYNNDYYRLAKTILLDVYETTGITATVGIGTNLFLSKVALDILSKHDKNNIAFLDEKLFKEKLWKHQPISDFWHIGPKTMKRLEKYNIYNMHDITLTDEKLLYREFGINALLIIDHANGIETCTIKDIKNYKPSSNSFSSSQILFRNYSYDETIIILREMIEELVGKIIVKKMKTRGLALYIGYSKKEEVKSVKISKKLEQDTNNLNYIIKEYISMYKKEVKKDLKIRKVGISFFYLTKNAPIQLSLFNDEKMEYIDNQLQENVELLKNKYGNNTVLKAISYSKAGNQINRNKLVGGHNAE